MKDIICYVDGFFLLLEFFRVIGIFVCVGSMAANAFLNLVRDRVRAIIDISNPIV